MTTSAFTLNERQETFRSKGNNVQTQSILEQRLSSKLIDAEMAMGHRYGEFNNSVRKTAGSVLLPSMSRATSGPEIFDHANIGNGIKDEATPSNKKSLL